MKPFDLEAAKKGAKVCTREGDPVRILCFDLKDPDWPIVASYTSDNGMEYTEFYTASGKHTHLDESCLDLMMADDDYMEKLERGEYSTPVWQGPHRIMTPEQIASQPFASIADEGYWRKMYAGMAMQGICAAHGTTKSAEHIARGAVECANSLIYELKKEA